MKTLIRAFLLTLLAAAGAAAQTAAPDIVPKPKSVQMLAGEFRMNLKTKIVANDPVGRRSAAVLNDLLLSNFGFKLEVVARSPKSNAIIFISKGFPLDRIKPEAYGLNVTPKGMLVYGQETGQFYAIQTILQLLPVDFKGAAVIPAVDIADEPRFAYRGMHLDVGRHFMPVSFIKKFLDLLATYKFNQFHWHLTEDQGWRIEIKKYPRLTEIGSKRPETMLEKNFNPYKGDGRPVEGFYTQAQIREVVAYAKARRINVIPEIELPGHSSAALAAYPEFGCKENYPYKVQTTWGIFKEVFCPTEATFRFLEDVLTETIALFPDSPYIHIGGDEVLKDHWKESAFVQELKKRENLKDEHEVQSYFIRRIEKFINSKGKIIIGWDEILEGGLAPNAVVMSWRGERGGIEAAKSKHNVIMTPTGALYFDYGQGDPKYEPINIGNHLPIETVYAYNPIPKELTEEEAKYVLGAQANIWTEYLKTPAAVEYMAFPRMLALAEVVWTPLEAKDFADFERRLGAHYARLDRRQVNYRIPEPDGLRNMVLENGADKAVLRLRSRIPNARIHYTLDGSTPTESAARLAGETLEVPVADGGTVEVKLIVVNANGRSSVPYTATLMRRRPLEPVEAPDKRPGVTLSFFKGAFKDTRIFPTLEPTEKRESKSIQLPQFAEKTGQLAEPFGARFEGLLNVPADGIYEFQIEADDAGTLLVGGETVIEIADAGDTLRTRYGSVPLKKGLHRIDLRYLQTGGAAVFNLRWGVKGTGLRRIFGNELFY